MYGQLYHRTISRELPEPQRDPRGRARRGGCAQMTPRVHRGSAGAVGGAGNIFAPCMIFVPSTRKGALDGKICTPCILNRPIAPGNGCIGRRCCHLDLEKHAFRADIARKGTFFAHSAKKGCTARESCQPEPCGSCNTRGGAQAAMRGGRDADGMSAARWARQAHEHGTRARLARGGSAGGTIRPNAQASLQRAPSALR